VTGGVLAKRGFRIFVMPESLALSAAEAESIRAFLLSPTDPAASGRAVLCDGTPGLFDHSGRLRPRSGLEDWFPRATSETRSYAYFPGERTLSRDGDIARYARSRLAAEPDLGWGQWVAEVLRGLTPEVRVPLKARTRVHRFKLGAARLYAFERNISYHMSEDLKQAGGNEALEKPVSVAATLAAAAHLYDLRTQSYLGRTDRLQFTLDPWQPSLFAALSEQVPAETLMSFLERQATPER